MSGPIFSCLSMGPWPVGQEMLHGHWGDIQGSMESNFMSSSSPIKIVSFIFTFLYRDHMLSGQILKMSTLTSRWACVCRQNLILHTLGEVNGHLPQKQIIRDGNVCPKHRWYCPLNTYRQERKIHAATQTYRRVMLLCLHIFSLLSFPGTAQSLGWTSWTFPGILLAS